MSFSVAEEGYDRESVHAFLVEVAEALRLVQAAFDEVRARSDSYISPVLKQAHEVAEQTSLEAQRECDVHRRRAEQEAAALRQRAEREVEEITVTLHEMTSGLRQKQEALTARITQEAQDARRRALGEASVQSSNAAADARALRTRSTEQAQALLEEAVARARALEEAADRSARELLASARDGIAVVERYEQGLARLVVAYQTRIRDMRELRVRLLEPAERV